MCFDSITAHRSLFFITEGSPSGKAGLFMTGDKRVIINLSVAVKQQIVSETPPGGATTTTLKPGANLIVNTCVLNVVARAQFDQWEPYIGAGPPGFLAQLNMKNRVPGRDPLAISIAPLTLMPRTMPTFSASATISSRKGSGD